MSSPVNSSVGNLQHTSYLMYAVLVVAMLVGASFLFVLSHSSQSVDKEYLGEFAEIRNLAQQFSVYAREAATGTGGQSSFNNLKAARDQFEKRWQKLSQNIDSIAKKAGVNGGSIASAWLRLEAEANTITSKQVPVMDLSANIAQLNKDMSSLERQFRAIADLYAQSPDDKLLAVVAERQMSLAEQMNNRLAAIFSGNDPVIAAQQIEVEVISFSSGLNAMRRGDPARGITAPVSPNIKKALERTADDFKKVPLRVREIQQQVKELAAVKASNNEISNASMDILKASSDIIKVLYESSGGGLYVYLGASFGAASVIFLVLLIVSVKGQTSRLLTAEAEVRAEVESANQRNQQAILRLLDELGDLADGDLTVETTVTEDFTGAIADSINFTIDQLRSLVSTINETAVKVTSAAQETQDTARNLAEASDHQAQEITGASAAINQMAMSIDQVSANALESASVAERSVEIANKGGDVVRATIKGMDTIREQIQETTKRIKRLGESSQEIGGIVSLINDIADQTNILALNAAIQASMAGDAGRGFAVVADEVQRLAERASAATKQIGALVKTIQNDTNEAVISMEQTTTQVVNGARLAQDAGVALGEIETVSKGLADLIQNISNAARQQAASAGQISKTMNVVQQITSQTSAGTTATANSVGHLAELAVQMRNSVAGFKLPA